MSDKGKWVGEWTKKELLSLPHRDWDETVDDVYSIVLVQGSGRSHELHDSGYRRIHAIAVGVDGVPFCILTSCSDVVHIEGIGGMGKWVDSITKWQGPQGRGWNIHCLPKSGFMQLWCHGSKVDAGRALSSFEIFSDPVSREVK